MLFDDYDEGLEIKAKVKPGVDGMRDKPSAYGICSKCSHFGWRKTALMDEEVWCEYDDPRAQHKLQPNSVDVINSCSNFYPAGQLSLSSMFGIAYIIDVEEKKCVVGFTGPKEKVVTITDPETYRKKNKDE